LGRTLCINGDGRLEGSDQPPVVFGLRSQILLTSLVSGLGGDQTENNREMSTGSTAPVKARSNQLFSPGVYILQFLPLWVLQG